MQECFSRYPTVYNKTGNDDDDDDDDLDDATKDDKKSKNGSVFDALGIDNDVDTVDQIDDGFASGSSQSNEKSHKTSTDKSE